MAKRYRVRKRRRSAQEPASKRPAARQPETARREAHQLASLQRRLGNNAVQRMIEAGDIQRQPAGQKGALTDTLSNAQLTPQQLWTMHHYDSTVGVIFVEQWAIMAAQEYDALQENERRRDEARRRGQPVPESVTEAIETHQAAFQGYVGDIRTYLATLNGLRLRAAIEKGMWQFLRLASPARTLRRLTRQGGTVATTRAFFNRVKREISNIRNYARHWS